MLNDYLNNYSDKLSRGNPFDPSEIKIDHLNYSSVANGVDKKTYDPCNNLINLKQQADRMNKQLMRSENPRYMSKQLKEQLYIIEEKEVQKEMLNIQRQFQPDFKNIKHKYMQSSDINNFKNFRSMLDNLSSKTCSH